MFRTLQRKFDIRVNVACVQTETDKTLSVTTIDYNIYDLQLK